MAKTEDSEGQPIEWPKPPVPGVGSTVGDRIEYTLAEGVRRFFGLFDEPLAELFSWGLRLILKIIEKTIGPYTTPLIDEVLEVMEPDDPMRKVLTRLKEAKGEAAAGILTSLAGGTAAAGLMSGLEPFFEAARQRSYLSRPVKKFDPATAIAALWRGELSNAQADNILRRFGFETALHSKLQEVARPRLPEMDMGRWYLRDKGRESVLTDELAARGMTPQDIARFIELLDVIPPPPDLIRMAVREAFDPAIVREYQLDADTHKVPYDLLEKVGLKKEMANYYWYAHWILPSVLQGYEMLHRGEINEGQLETLMKSLDIMPGWIPKLIAISYRPYTRVDVRRMYGIGVLDEAAVLRAYRDIGFGLEKAQKMTEFTIGFYLEDERDATKTDILTAYFEGVINRELAAELLGDIGYTELYIETYLSATDYRIEQRRRKDEDDDTGVELAKERELTKADILSYYLDGGLTESEAVAFLSDLDYPASVIDVLIAKTDLRRMQRLLKEEISTTKALYVNEEIMLADVHERLGRYALPATQVDELLVLWDIEKERRTERPSKSELLNWYLNGVIEESYLREQMTKHKFSADYIELYVANTNYVILEREKKELEREQKEQERLAKAEFKTDRMVALQNLNVQIAELRVLIAELKAMMITIVPPGTKDQMRIQIRVKEEEIATFEVTIAELKQAIAEAIETVPTLVDPEDVKALKSTILSIKTEIAGIEVEIARLREEVAAIRTEMSKVVEPAERLAYVTQIAQAKEEIARLQLLKAQVPVTIPAA